MFKLAIKELGNFEINTEDRNYILGQINNRSNIIHLECDGLSFHVDALIGIAPLKELPDNELPSVEEMSDFNFTNNK